MTTSGDRGGGGVALVGCGAWGRNIARCLAELGALSAVIDHHGDAAAALAERHGVRVTSLEDALADPAVVAVAVATQPARHHAVAMEALAAGRHVFVEKPLALDLREARQMVEAAQARGRVLMVGHILRHHPAFVRLAGLVAEGRLGRLRRIHAARMGLGAIRVEEDALWCLAPHDVSMILALTGRMPETVDAVAEHPLDRAPADAVTLHLGFAGGPSALVEVSWLHPVKEQRLTVIGTDGMAVFDDTLPWERKLTLHMHRVAGDGTIRRAEPDPVPLPPGEPLKAEIAAFLAAIRDGGEPLTGGAEALSVMEVLTRAASSHYVGGRIRQEAEAEN